MSFLPDKGSFWEDIGLRDFANDIFGVKTTDTIADFLGAVGDPLYRDPKTGEVDIGKVLGIGGGIASLMGLFDREQPRLGYQGEIPRYQAVRADVPRQPEPNRRPGSGPQRNFSDVIYAQRPSQPVPTVAEALQRAQAQAAQLAQQTPVDQPEQTFAMGGLAALRPKQGYYLGGMTDGMADRIPAKIDGRQEAALSDGEFVVPADVVSHLGNGNSNAGAKQLYDMMERIRKARTGNPNQGRQINPKRQLPV